ncbi:MAG: hypothetical protein AAGK00_18490 [Pseudomonadota bacterium]
MRLTDAEAKAVRLSDAERDMLRRLCTHSERAPYYPQGTEEWQTCKSLARKGLVQRSGVFALDAGVQVLMAQK